MYRWVKEWIESRGATEIPEWYAPDCKCKKCTKVNNTHVPNGIMHPGFAMNCREMIGRVLNEDKKNNRGYWAPTEPFWERCPEVTKEQCIAAAKVLQRKIDEDSDE